MDSDGVRIRVVVMGDNKVGKTSILQRFLYNSFKPKYKPTVEDLYSQDFQIGDSALKVDFLDTAGDDQFPVMRRLSISSGHAFLLVYSITCPDSLKMIHTRLEEIKSQRSDFKEVPIILAGNKTDLADVEREIYVEDVRDWLEQDFKQNKITVLECSALNSYNIVNIFKSFLALSKIDFGVLNGGQAERSTQDVPQYCSASSSPLSDLSTSSSPSHADNVFTFDKQTQFVDKKDNHDNGSQLKPRSRSLIRRSSKKVKQKINEVNGIENCVVN